jgi:hypothetical protein
MRAAGGRRRRLWERGVRAGASGRGVRAGRQGGASERGISRSNRASRKARCFAPNLSMGALCFTIDDVLRVLCRSVGRFAHLASPDSQGGMVRWLKSHSENLAGQGSRSWLAIREVRDGGGASRFLKGEMPKWRPCMPAATHCLVCFVMPADRGFCHNDRARIYSSCQHPSMVKQCCDALCNARIVLSDQVNADLYGMNRGALTWPPALLDSGENSRRCQRHGCRCLLYKTRTIHFGKEYPVSRIRGSGCCIHEF